MALGGGGALQNVTADIDSTLTARQRSRSTEPASAGLLFYLLFAPFCASQLGVALIASNSTCLLCLAIGQLCRGRNACTDAFSAASCPGRGRALYPMPVVQVGFAFGLSFVTSALARSSIMSQYRPYLSERPAQSLRHRVGRHWKGNRGAGGTSPLWT